MRIQTAIQPHTQFRSEEQAIARDIAAGGSLEIALPTRFRERPGDVVENPFLILRISDGAVLWHVFARVRVTAGARGEPIAGNTLAITSQRAGISV